MGRNNVNDINFSFCVMTCFVKTLVLNDVNKMGQQVQIHFNFFEKTLKFLRAKLKILELHQNNLKTPKSKNNTPNIISPHVKPPKWQEANWRLWNFKIPKQKPSKFTRKKAHTSFSCLWNFTQKIEDSRTSKYQNKRPLKFIGRKANTPFLPLWNFTQKN